MDRAKGPRLAGSASPHRDASSRTPTTREPGVRAGGLHAAVGDGETRRRPVRIVGAPPDVPSTPESAEVALRALPVAGLSRRRFGWLAGIVVSVWIVAVFARQVGEASAAGVRADRVRADNAALAAQVTALQHERDLVQEQSFVELQARSFGLGTSQDQRFVLSQNAPSLAPDAPGSASLRLAPEPTPQSPLDAWLALLFGPSR